MTSATPGVMPSCAKGDPFASKSILSSTWHRAGITYLKFSSIYLSAKLAKNRRQKPGPFRVALARQLEDSAGSTQPMEEDMKRSPLPRTTRMIRLPEVMAICGLSRSTVYAYTKRGEFPARVKITRHASAWVREEVLAWVESRIHASRSCTPTPAENRETGV
ncbi:MULTISPECIES: AlpA family transcriptional regulator [unclassified Duganella]|nr:MULTISPECIES: AlpA family transcriptional regulator [unclassified Duganella]